MRVVSRWTWCGKVAGNRCSLFGVFVSVACGQIDRGSTNREKEADHQEKNQRKRFFGNFFGHESIVSQKEDLRQ